MALDTFSAFLAKEMLEPMRPLFTSLQGRLVEVYTLVSTKLKKLLNVKSYTEIRNAIDLRFQGMYQKAVSLSELEGEAEERPRVCSRQRNRENYQEESAAQYWTRTVAIPFLDVICSELKRRLSKE